MSNNTTSIISKIINTSSQDLHKLSEDQVGHKPNPQKWSKKEILGHLIDSATNNHRRFKQFLNQEHLVFGGYNQDNEVLINDYQHRPFSDIIKLWSGMNQQIIQMIKAIPENRITKSYAQHNYHIIGFKRIPAEQASSIEYLILDYIGHMEHHLSQIIPNYERQLGEY